jgi:serine/threonine protein kinase
MKAIKLKHEWILGERIGGGGFGVVYFAKSSNTESAVAKLVPKVPGAQRELLFVKLDGVRNIVPIIDSGETEDSWVLIMPKAEKSLRQHLDDARGPLDASDAITVLQDIATSLFDLSGKVVHRDLKPENVLLLNGTWCLADFGISRYAEATTAVDTQKYALSAPYAAPERWRGERATSATDVYSLGVIAFELLSKSLPFAGPELSDFREQHLHGDPRSLGNATPSMKALVSECLYKAPEARPNPGNIVARLKAGKTAAPTESASRARLRDANLAVVAHQSESARQASEQRSEADRRKALCDDATKGLKEIADALLEVIREDAPSAIVNRNRDGSWSVRLNTAEFQFGSSVSTTINPWGGWEPPAIGVIAHGGLGVVIPRDRYDYEGRSHSLWYCDAQEKGRYRWFETAFMITPISSRRALRNPFALDPGVESAKALWTGLAEFQLAWPFTPLDIGDLDEFVDRWVGWFADAAQGRLQHPRSMPERPAEESWRRR